MATTKHETEVVQLIDGTKIELRPLKISLLKPFMKKFEEISKVADNNEKSMSVLMECVGIAMQQYSPDLAENLVALEDNIDLPTVYKIVEAASGVQLGEKGLI